MRWLCMKCLYPFQKRDQKTGVWMSLPCGKCLPCRVTKQSTLVLRLLLESQHAVTSSCWTLTLKDECLTAASVENRAATVKNFFAALRDSERRAGNSIPIRYSGCLEFGGLFGRPHWHFLIFNLIRNYRDPIQWKRTIPREPIPIGQWPHGRVDVMEFNKKTIRYVCKYLTDYGHLKNTDTPPPVQYRSLKPGIGFSGISALAASHAAKHTHTDVLPSFFQIGNNIYPLDRWTKKTFRKEYERHGGTYQRSISAVEENAIRLKIAEAEKDMIPEYVRERERQKVRSMYAKQSQAQAEKESKEQAISRRALNRQALRDQAENSK